MLCYLPRKKQLPQGAYDLSVAVIYMDMQKCKQFKSYPKFQI